MTDQYQYSFDLESTVGLSGNTRYWISIYMGDLSNPDPTVESAFLWQQTSNSGVLGTDGRPHQTLNATSIPPAEWITPNPDRPNTAFQLYGAYDVPAPGTVLLFAPLALLAWRHWAGRSERTLQS